MKMIDEESKTTMECNRIRNTWADKVSHPWLSNRWVMAMWGLKE